MILAPCLALLALVSSSLDDDPLLPPAPEGWTYERLDLPLAFAPDLPYRGYEELLFAPGMFEADAPGYFSYVATFRLEGDADLTTASVDHLLTEYYVGLCKGVAQSRQLELDFDAMGVDVVDDGERFIAEVRMFDAFVTGGPLTLRFELDVHPKPEQTELFGIASPAAQDAAIWEELRGLREKWYETRTAPVFLNHLYLVPDRATFDALKASEFLRTEFAAFEERTTVRPDLTYTGLYLYGHRTYFEFLPPGQSREIAEGNSGIAFGLERPGATAELCKRIQEREIQTFQGPLTREVEEQAVPWFEIAGIEGVPADTNLSLFTMEYSPEFLARFHPDRRPADPGIRRRHVLERYASKLDARDRPFRDVTDITLELEAPQVARLLELAEVFGYRVEDGTLVHAPEFRMKLVTVEKARGVVGFTMTLREPLRREPLELGKARFTFEGETARFELRP